MPTNYPECEKLAKVAKQSQVLGEFLNWLKGFKEFELAKWNLHGEDRLVPMHDSTESLLAEFFGIDMDKVEKERQQIIDGLRGKG